MLNYSLVSIVIGLNVIIYFLIHIPLDIRTHFYRERKTHSEIEDRDPPAWKKKPTMVITVISSLYLWFLFIVIPITAIIENEFFYKFAIIIYEPYNSILQTLGILIIIIATIVACTGRISWNTRAISWGIPKRLEVKGMFRFIRHPLYASYCYYFIGFSLTFQSLLIFPLLTGIYGYYQTSLYEESILLKQFGIAYSKYQKKVGRFFPRLIR